MPTPRLHYDDPLRLRSEAAVVAHGTLDGRPTIVLAETIFYPESGGQQSDWGTISGARIDDVQRAGDGTIHHVVAEGTLPALGSIATCAVDEKRRRQHMALHSAQHCLSRALLDLLDAVTLSSRLGASGCTIDVDRDGLTLAELAPANALVNAVIDEDREVRQYFPEPAELAALPLRKPPSNEGRVRVVDVDGFDQTPCGGTHVTRTSQIELVYLRSAERYKGGTRITFDAGPRAREQLLSQRRTLLDAAAALRCAPHELVDAVERQHARLSEAQKGQDVLRQALAERWAEELEDGEAVLVATIPLADEALLQAVGARLSIGTRVVALAAPQADGVAVLITRGPAAEAHAGELLRDVAARTGGRGGGRPEHARGRLPSGADFESAFREALADT